MTRHILVALSVLALGLHAAHAEGRKLVVVVALSSPVTDLSHLDLKRCFLGDTIEVDDSRLVPFNAEPNTDARVGFDQTVLGMSRDQVGRYWVDRKVRGQGAAPRSLPAAHLGRVIAKFPGAIGYVTVDQLTPDLKPVKIDGISYDDPRYSIATR